MIEIERGVALYDAIYTPQMAMARVSHLGPDQQRQVEQITRIIRVGFDPGRMIEPRPRIARIMLVPPEFRPGRRPPDHEFWIIVTNRLFTRRRLWRSVRREIRQAMGGDCRVWLSFTSTYWFKVGAESDDEFIAERMAAGITLYYAKHDDPLRRCPHGSAEEGRP